ncbi:MAG: 23S rRNA (adenine(2503)-C(2))-methyltransferase RlmN [Desulfovibrionaceae bacterium]
MIELLNLRPDELDAFFRELGEKPFRAKQVWQWLWARECDSFAAMTNLSKALRETLAARAVIRHPDIRDTRVSSDGTVKLLLGLADGETVETVLIPEKDHITQCLSTQVGCALGCAFCSTGQMGLTRNLTQAEICGQILAARRYLQGVGEPLTLRNLVFMGMGEPMLNFRELMRSLATLTDPKGMNFSPRRITVSTAGITKGLRELGESDMANLAVSLHAPNQALRERLMPVAKTVPLDQLMAALRDYPLKPRQRLTFEYILLGGVNDGPEHARELARLLAGLKAKVNLIAYNPPKDGPAPFAAPTEEAILAFEKVLWNKDLTVILRKSKGQDIAAACGQLKAERTAAAPDPDPQ